MKKKREIQYNDKRNGIIQRLKDVLSGTGQRILVPVGSSRTGLATKASDIDLVLITSSDPIKRIDIIKSFVDASFRRFPFFLNILMNCRSVEYII